MGYPKPVYACSSEQILNTVKQLRALKAVRKWLVDTGCGSDLINRDLANKYAMYLRECKPVVFNTANDSAGSTQQLHLACEELGGDLVEAYVMGSTPPVMSVGKRIKRGFSFVRMTGFAPCFITPMGDVVALDVRSDIPYLKADGLHQKLAGDPRLIADATGVSVVRGKVKLVGVTAKVAGECSAEEIGVEEDGMLDTDGLPLPTTGYGRPDPGIEAQGGDDDNATGEEDEGLTSHSETTLFTGSEDPECKTSFWPDSGWESEDDWNDASSDGSTAVPAPPGGAEGARDDLDDPEQDVDMDEIIRHDPGLADDYLCEVVEPDERERKRELYEYYHCFRHKPHNPRCSLCMIANTKNDLKYRHPGGSSRKGMREPKKWGDLATKDFLHFTAAWKDGGQRIMGLAGQRWTSTDKTYLF